MLGFGVRTHHNGVASHANYSYARPLEAEALRQLKCELKRVEVPQRRGVQGNIAVHLVDKRKDQQQPVAPNRLTEQAGIDHHAHDRGQQGQVEGHETNCGDGILQCTWCKLAGPVRHC